MSVRRIGASLVLAGLLAVPAWAQSERTGDEVSKDVQAQVLSYPRFTIFDDVSASVDGGAITLTGSVTTPWKRSELEKRVQKVAGVATVQNQIRVLPVSHGDDELRYEIARAIYSSVTFRPFASMANPPIHIIVEHGHVTLTGVVATEVDRMLARTLASSFGAFSVKVELKTDAEATVKP